MKRNKPKLAGISIPGYKLDKNGKITKDHAAAEAKLDLCTRLKRRGSSKVKVAKPGIRPGKV
jgi:hypothetical protein